METEVTDDSWRARARDRMRPLTVGQLIAKLAKLDAGAVVLTDCVLIENADYPVQDGEGLAAATRVVQLESGEVLIATDEDR
jgi:hypothetical protein